MRPTAETLLKQKGTLMQKAREIPVVGECIGSKEVSKGLRMTDSLHKFEG